MKVFYCAYEVAPFFKKGGLGDVAGSLPKALKRLGVDIQVVMPGYNEITKQQNNKTTKKGSFKVEFDEREEEIGIWETVLPGNQVRIYFFENERYLSELKESEEKYEQFAFFSKAITEFLRYTLQVTRYKIDLVHLNDWHTALVPLLLKLSESKWGKPATLLTIHNFSHQGVAPLDVLLKLGISKQASRVLEWDVSDQNLEMLMQGIIYSDIVNTVSPKYSKEILAPGFIGRLGDVLKGKEARVKGILNGIDDEVWDPETDKLIEINYTLRGLKRSDPPPQSGGKHPAKRGFPSGSDLSLMEAASGGVSLAGWTLRNKGSPILGWQEGKRLNKLALQKELGLEVNEKIPLLAFIGRLAKHQKGIGILYETLVKLLHQVQFQFVLLGKGSEVWEDNFSELDKKGLVRTFIRFDEPLAHQIYAGADFLLVPSKFEPCGLVQMIAMRYGTLPIVRKTGGLADTVKDGVNGFVFEEYSSRALAECIKQALHKFQISNFKFQIIERAMSEDFSWERSAKEYLKLYEQAIEIKKRS